MESRFSFNVVVVFFVRFSAPPNFTQFAFDEELSPISFPPTRLKYAEKYALSHIKTEGHKFAEIYVEYLNRSLLAHSCYRSTKRRRTRQESTLSQSDQKDQFYRTDKLSKGHKSINEFRVKCSNKMFKSFYLFFGRPSAFVCQIGLTDQLAEKNSDLLK